MSTTKKTPWLRKLLGKKTTVTSKNKFKRSTPLLKRIKRLIYGQSPKRSMNAEGESWTKLYRFPTELIKNTVFPGSAVINGAAINAHLSMITNIYPNHFDIIHISNSTVKSTQINIGNYNLSPESCCLTYVGDKDDKVRQSVARKLTAMNTDDFSYSYSELCRIVFNQHCKETNSQTLKQYANDITNQSNIICSGIFLHVYIKTFIELKLDLSFVFPLNPFACTPARIIDVLKHNNNWSVVPLKLLLLATPLAYKYPMDPKQKKAYDDYLSEANCSLITMDSTGACDVTSVAHNDRDVVNKDRFYWTDVPFKFIPGIYDNKENKTLIKPLFICGTHPSQKSTHVQYQASQRK